MGAAQKAMVTLPRQQHRRPYLQCVLHQPGDARKGFETLLRKVKSGGHIPIGLYGQLKLQMLLTRVRDGGLFIMIGDKGG